MPGTRLMSIAGKIPTSSLNSRTQAAEIAAVDATDKSKLPLISTSVIGTAMMATKEA